MKKYSQKKSPSTKLKDNYYDKDHLNKLFQVLPSISTIYQLAILLTITTGVRLGELEGLQWHYIDVDKHYILIEQSESYNPNTGVIVKPNKTKNIRNISNRLGHSRTSITADFYAHALESVERKSPNVFQEIFTNGSESSSEKEVIKNIK